MGGSGRGEGNAVGELPDVEVGLVPTRAQGPMTKGKMLAEILQRSAPESGQTATLTNVSGAFVEVRQECRLCESCAQNFPGCALSRESDIKGVWLSFQPYRCLGCSHCEKICPHGLLESRPLGVEDFPIRRRRVLCGRRKTKCADCERPFMPTDNSDVCSTCRRLQKLDQEMLETLG